MSRCISGECTGSGSTRLVFGITYYVMLCIVIGFFIMDWLYFGSSMQMQQRINQWRDVSADLMALLIPTGMIVFAHYIYNNNLLTGCKSWWIIMGSLYLFSGYYWVHYYYNVIDTPVNVEQVCYTVMKCMTMIYFIVSSIFLLRTLSGSGYFSPFEIFPSK
jgi:hypothetical protein